MRLVVIISALLLAGCGTTMQAAYGSLATAERLAVDCAAGFPDFDREHQRRIIELADSKEKGADALAAWREKRENIVKAIEGTHASVKLARDAIHDIEQGVREKHELQKWIAPALRAAMNLREVLRAMGVKIPGVL